MNGDWMIKLTGRGKIRPHDADEIEELYVDFIAKLVAAGHELKGYKLVKAKDTED